MTTRHSIYLAGFFYAFFLLLTPLGLFNDWIPPLTQTGYYSITTVDGGDDTGYYAYLRSAFFDGDLDFLNERYYAHFERFNETGYVFNNWQLGQAVLVFPFFLLGHLAALILSGMGYSVSVDGYSAPYFLSTALASATYLFLGLLLMAAVLRRFFSERVAWITTLCVWLGSPLVYYTFIRSRMAHTTEFFLAALAVWVWLRYRESESRVHHGVIGACLGLLCLVRLINGCYVAVYAADRIILWFVRRGTWTRQSILQEGARVAWAAGLFLIVLLPQFIAWHQLNGFFLSTYLVDTVQGQAGAVTSSLATAWGKIYDLFLGPQWGMLWVAPLWFAGLVGLLVRSPVPGRTRMVLGIGLMVLCGTVLSFIESDAYGNRYLIPAAVILSLGLGTLFHRFESSRWGWRGVAGIAVVCIALQYLMMMQYKIFFLHNHPRFALEAIANVPALFSDYPALLLRSTNWIQLMLLNGKGAWNYLDVLYLVIFPLVQLGILAMIIWAVFCWNRVSIAIQRLLSPRIVAGGAVALSLILSVGVGLATPDKSVPEIQARKNYVRYLHEGDRLLESKKYDEARSQFSQAREQLPRHWNPVFRIGLSYHMEGNHGEAARFYSRAESLYPDHQDLLFNYGNVLRLLGDLESAEPRLRASLRKWPRNKLAYDALAQLYAELNRPREAESMLLTAVRADPGYGTGHANLAVLYARMNQSDRAVFHLNNAIRLGVRGPVIDSLVMKYGTPLEPQPGEKRAVSLAGQPLKENHQ